jgi:hypothetical protein
MEGVDNSQRTKDIGALVQEISQGTHRFLNAPQILEFLHNPNNYRTEPGVDHKRIADQYITFILEQTMLPNRRKLNDNKYKFSHEEITDAIYNALQVNKKLVMEEDRTGKDMDSNAFMHRRVEHNLTAILEKDTTVQEPQDFRIDEDGKYYKVSFKVATNSTIAQRLDEMFKYRAKYDKKTETGKTTSYFGGWKIFLVMEGYHHEFKVFGKKLFEIRIKPRKLLGLNNSKVKVFEEAGTTSIYMRLKPQEMYAKLLQIATWTSATLESLPIYEALVDLKEKILPDQSTEDLRDTLETIRLSGETESLRVKYYSLLSNLFDMGRNASYSGVRKDLLAPRLEQAKQAGEGNIYLRTLQFDKELESHRQRYGLNF